MENSDRNDTIRRLSRNEKIWIFSIVLSYFASNTAIAILNPFFPHSVVVIGAPKFVVGLILCTPFIPQLLLSPFMHRIILFFGSAKLLKIGLAIHSLATAAMGFTDKISNTTIFILTCVCLKFIQGIGYGFIPTACAFIASDKITHRTSLVLGLLETGAGIGYTIGPMFGGILYDNFGYACPQLAVGVILAVILLMCCYTLRDINVCCNSEDVSVNGVNDNVTASRLLKIPAISLLITANIYSAAVLIYLDIFVPMYLTLKLHETATLTGIILFVAGIVYTLFSSLLGHRVDKTSKTKEILIIGSILTTVVFSVVFVLSFIQHTVSMPTIAGFIIIVAMPASMIYLPIFKLMKETVTSHGIIECQQLNAVLSNFLITALIIGQLIGTTTAGFTYQYLGFKWSCLCWIIISVVLTIGFTTVIKKKRRDLQNENRPLLSEQDVYA
ncbi:Uncharacterised protein g9648 [Pycnogonum litorale]